MICLIVCYFFLYSVLDLMMPPVERRNVVLNIVFYGIKCFYSRIILNKLNDDNKYQFRKVERLSKSYVHDKLRSTWLLGSCHSKDFMYLRITDIWQAQIGLTQECTE